MNAAAHWSAAAPALTYGLLAGVAAAIVSARVVGVLVHLVPGGLATEALVATVLLAGFGLGCGLPRMLLRLARTEEEAVRPARPPAQLAANVAGVAALAFAVLAMLAIAVADQAEAVRGHLIARFVWPPWIYGLVLAAGVLAIGLLVGVPAGTCMTVARGWARWSGLRDGGRVGLAGLLGLAGGGWLAGQSPEGVLPALALLTLFIACACAVLSPLPTRRPAVDVAQPADSPAGRLVQAALAVSWAAAWSVAATGASVAAACVTTGLVAVLVMVGWPRLAGRWRRRMPRGPVLAALTLAALLLHDPLATLALLTAAVWTGFQRRPAGPGGQLGGLAWLAPLGLAVVAGWGPDGARLGLAVTAVLACGLVGGPASLRLAGGGAALAGLLAMAWPDGAPRGGQPVAEAATPPALADVLQLDRLVTLVPPRAGAEEGWQFDLAPLPARGVRVEAAGGAATLDEAAWRRYAGRLGRWCGPGTPLTLSTDAPRGLVEALAAGGRPAWRLTFEDASGVHERYVFGAGVAAWLRERALPDGARLGLTPLGP